MITKLKKSTKREAIKKAAERLFKCEGFCKTSMDQIAEEAGVSKQTIYSHFGSKECLFSKLFPCKSAKKPVQEEASKTQSDIKREAIIEAAEEAFIQYGYIATSMDYIAEQADVSKQTIYSHFGNKNALFKSIMERKCANNKDDAFERLKTEELTQDPRDILHNIVDQFLRHILAGNAMNLFRMVIAESKRDPELAEMFMENGPVRTRAQFETYFRREHSLNRLNIPDPEEAARFITSMFLGGVMLDTLVMPQKEPSEEDIKAHINLIVDSFMRIYGKKTQKKRCLSLMAALSIPAAIATTLALTACVTTGDPNIIQISKAETQVRHMAYTKANHYCKSRGQYAFTENGMDSETHFVFKCK
jgi:TetR/AcrR family transcriptional repressor of mexJK operon